MLINKSKLLKALQCVQSGVAKKDLIEQSDCFAFRDGDVFTYNQEVACQMESGLPKDFIGAIKAKPLTHVLSKSDQDELEFRIKENEVIIDDRYGEEIGFSLEREIKLQSAVPPKEWLPLNKKFFEGVKIVASCAQSNTNTFKDVLHISKEAVECTDGVQACRYDVETPFENVCVRADTIDSLITDVNQCAESKSWIYFKNDNGLIISLRKFADEISFPNVKALLDKSGEKLEIPLGLGHAIKKASVFCAEMGKSKRIDVVLSGNKFIIKGIGVSGWYKKEWDVEFNNETHFLMAPDILTEIPKKSSSCEVLENKLKVKGDNWTYFTALGYEV